MESVTLSCSSCCELSNKSGAVSSQHHEKQKSSKTVTMSPRRNVGISSGLCCVSGSGRDRRYCAVTFVCMFLLYVIATVNGERCGGSLQQLHVTSQSTGIIYSPRYPHLYLNFDECRWLLTTDDAGKVIQLDVIDQELQPLTPDYGDSDEKDGGGGGDCQDYLVAYDGTSETSSLLKKWCGTERVLIRSTGQNMYIKFVANHVGRYKGFAVRYHAVTPYSTGCADGRLNTVKVGSSPFLLHISDLDGTESCSWQLETDSISSRLVLDLLHVSGYLSCQDGHVSVYDGTDRHVDPRVVQWCGNSAKSPPFSSVYSASDTLLLTTSLAPTDQRKSSTGVSLNLWISARAEPIEAECVSHVPIVEFSGDGPLYLSLPFHDDGVKTCGVHVYHKSAENVVGGLRVDVVVVDNENASCDHLHNATAVVAVHDDYRYDSRGGKEVAPECWRGLNPVYWAQKRSILLNTQDDHSAYVRIQPTVFPCTGELIDNVYQGSETVMNHIRNLGYQRNSRCRFLIRGGQPHNHPVVDVRGQFLGEDDCGDVIRIHDGNSTKGRVLLKHCGSDGDDVMKTVVSSGGVVLLDFTTDDDDSVADVDIKYYSISEADVCGEKVKTFYASHTLHTLQSPNYPTFYPLNFDCVYRLRTNASREVIHVDLKSTDFSSTGDFLAITDGEGGESLGRVMGGEPLRSFTSTGQELLVRFHTDDNMSEGGWRLEYYSQRPLTVGKAITPLDMQFNKLTLVLVASMAFIILVLSIAVIITCCKIKGDDSDNRPPTPV